MTLADIDSFSYLSLLDILFGRTWLTQVSCRVESYLKKKQKRQQINNLLDAGVAISSYKMTKIVHWR
jgi:hypothetical protein